ncbi:MAG: hypothetical protein AB1700_03460 [Bacillota bacterium]
MIYEAGNGRALEKTVSSQTWGHVLWVVELKGTSQFAWISASAPHELVRYENKQAGTVSELVEYRRR